MKILYKIKSGSHLYGLTTPTSDVDYVGVYMEDTFEEFIDPFNTKDEIDISITSKQENGKNDENAVDEKYFHIKKFIKLCAENNPNILEMLYTPKNCIEYVDPKFKSLILDHPEMFVNAKLIDRFIGYAKSQEQKSYTKSENYLLLEKFKKWLEEIGDFRSRKETIEYALTTFKYNFQNGFSGGYTITNYILELGGMKFQFGITIKEAIARIKDRFARASHRVEGIFVNKYEPKFMSHTIRLLDEGYQLLSNGKINFPFTGKALEDIMNIKFGNTPVEIVVEIVNEYKNRLSVLEKTHFLPKTADYEAIKKRYHTLVFNVYEMRRYGMAMADTGCDDEF